MDKRLKPIEVSKKLNISTSSLRYYEDNGLFPKPDRDANGYRLYNELHILYLEAVKAMSLGFTMNVVSSVMKDIQNNFIDEAMWSMNKEQVQNRKEYDLLLSLKITLGSQNVDCEINSSIGKVAKALDISTSSLRYWEREDLIVSSRNKENNYRYYQKEEFVKAGMLTILQNVNYSKETVEIKEKIKNTKNDHLNLKYLLDQCELIINKRNHDQLQGLHYLHKLISN